MQLPFFVLHLDITFWIIQKWTLCKYCSQSEYALAAAARLGPRSHVLFSHGKSGRILQQSFVDDYVVQLRRPRKLSHLISESFSHTYPCFSATTVVLTLNCFLCFQECRFVVRIFVTLQLGGVTFAYMQFMQWCVCSETRFLVQNFANLHLSIIRVWKQGRGSIFNFLGDNFFFERIPKLQVLLKYLCTLFSRP